MITILTASYNRVDLLPRLFKSICGQTSNAFEWILVDDGSTDDTFKYMKTIMKMDLPFVVKCISQNNGGKHRALNRGLLLSSKDYIYIVDSDDQLPPDAIEVAINLINSLPGDDLLAGISGLTIPWSGAPKIFASQKIIYKDSPNHKRRENNLLGDHALIVKTNIFKRFLFPEYNGEKFITEDVVWDAMALAGHYFRWYNKVLYLADYQESGLTAQGEKKFYENYNGYTHYVTQKMLLYRGLDRLKSISHHLKISKALNIGIKQASDKLGVGHRLIILALAYGCVKSLVLLCKKSRNII